MTPTLYLPRPVSLILRWLALFVLLLLVTWWLAPHFVFADDGSLGDPSGPIDASDTLASVHLSAILVNGIVASFIPLLVGYLTKLTDSSWLKLGIEAVLAGLSAAIVQTTLADGTVILSQQTLLVWVSGMLAAAFTYAKAWKPNGLTSGAILVPGGPNGSTVSIPGKLALIGPRK